MTDAITTSWQTKATIGALAVIGGGYALNIDIQNNTAWAAGIGQTAVAAAVVGALGVPAFPAFATLTGRKSTATTVGKWAALTLTVLIAAIAYLTGLHDKMATEEKAATEYAQAVAKAARARTQAENAARQAQAYRDKAEAISTDGDMATLTRAVERKTKEVETATEFAVKNSLVCGRVNACKKATDELDAATTSLARATEKAGVIAQAEKQAEVEKAFKAEAEKAEAEAKAGSNKRDPMGETLTALIGGTPWGWNIGIDIALAVVLIVLTQCGALCIEPGIALVAQANAQRKAEAAARAEEAARIAAAEKAAAEKAAKAEKRKADAEAKKATEKKEAANAKRAATRAAKKQAAEKEAAEPTVTDVVKFPRLAVANDN